jgi:hypothetical protein
MTTRPISFVARFLRHVALPAVVTGSIALSSHVASAQSLQQGEVGTERTAATAETVATASGHARVHANGTESSGASAQLGAATARTPFSRAGAEGEVARARATISGPTGYEHSRAAVSFGGTASATVGDDGAPRNATAQLDVGAAGEARAWTDGSGEGSSARVRGRGQASAEQGERTAGASGRGRMAARASVTMRGNRSAAAIMGDGEAHAGGPQSVTAAVRVIGAHGRAASGRNYGANSRSASFAIRPAGR